MNPPALSYSRSAFALGGVLVALAAGVVPSQAQTPVVPSAAVPGLERKGAVRDVISEEALQREVKGTAKFDTLMAGKAKPLGESRPSMESSLWEHSLILFDGVQYTIVPQGSILRLPPTLQSRLVDKPQGDFVFWPTFLKKNFVWLTAKEVPLAMSKGDERLAKNVLREVATDPRVVVAVYKGGPIMILEPDTSAASAVAEQKTQPQKKGP